MKDEWYDLIYAYLEEEMSEEERNNFEAKCQDDTAFNTAFISEKKIFEGVNYVADKELRSKIELAQREVQNKEKIRQLPPKQNSNIRQLLFRAAALVGVVALAGLIYSNLDLLGIGQEANDDEARGKISYGHSSEVESSFIKAIPIFEVDHQQNITRSTSTIKVQIKQAYNEQVEYIFNNKKLTIYRNEGLSEQDEIKWYTVENHQPSNYLQLGHEFYPIIEDEQEFDLKSLSEKDKLPFMINLK